MLFFTLLSLLACLYADKENPAPAPASSLSLLSLLTPKKTADGKAVAAQAKQKPKPKPVPHELQVHQQPHEHPRVNIFGKAKKVHGHFGDPVATPSVNTNRKINKPNCDI